MRNFSLIALSLAAVVLVRPTSAMEFSCPFGYPVSANIGDGVIMHTCLWEKEPDVHVRAGPMQLIRNGILILQLQTNLKGKLHGQYRSWSDHGRLMETGNYQDGLKEGAWQVTDAQGNSELLHYRQGVLVEPSAAE